MLKALMEKVDNMCFSKGMEMVRKELNKNGTKKKTHEWSYRMLWQYTPQSYSEDQWTSKIKQQQLPKLNTDCVKVVMKQRRASKSWDCIKLPSI